MGQAAVLTADLMAQNVTIAGQVSGNIKCLHRLELLPTARLKGDIVAGSLVISEGAVFSGSSQMAEPPEETPGQIRNTRTPARKKVLTPGVRWWMCTRIGKKQGKYWRPPLKPWIPELF